MTHHERWDGTGYLDGLAGEAIPVAGRIVAVADVFDALTHDRPYKRAWALEDAVAEIERLSGQHFDPRVVDAFAALDHRRLLEPLERFDPEVAAPPASALESDHSELSIACARAASGRCDSPDSPFDVAEVDRQPQLVQLLRDGSRSLGGRHPSSIG